MNTASTWLALGIICCAKAALMLFEEDRDAIEVSPLLVSKEHAAELAEVVKEHRAKKQRAAELRQETSK